MAIESDDDSRENPSKRASDSSSARGRRHRCIAGEKEGLIAQQVGLPQEGVIVKRYGIIIGAVTLTDTALFRQDV
jgi:hypothetical protein